MQLENYQSNFKKPKVVSFLGNSGTGKTTLIEKIIKIYAAKNYRVSSIKHTDHELHADIEGKDSWRHKNAGAFSTLLFSKNSIAFFSDISDIRIKENLSISMDKLISRFFQGSDILIIEGFRDINVPKVELFRKEVNPELKLKYADNPECILVCGDVFIDGINKPQIDINEPGEIAIFIENKIIKN